MSGTRLYHPQASWSECVHSQGIPLLTVQSLCGTFKEFPILLNALLVNTFDRWPAYVTSRIWAYCFMWFVQPPVSADLSRKSRPATGIFHLQVTCSETQSPGPCSQALLGPPVVPFYPLFWGRFGSPTKIDNRNRAPSFSQIWRT